jgi:predicted Rossmann-fold nucleotide-binding protein
MWSGLIEWMKSTMLQQRLVDREDFQLVQVVTNIEDAAEIIRKSKEQFDRAFGRRTVAPPAQKQDRIKG